VSLGVRATVATVVVVAVMLLASCGGGGGNSQLATLTDDSCVYEGDTSLDAGTFTINLENKTGFFSAFALARLSNGKTIGDLQPYLEKARAEFAETGTLRAPPFPTFYEQVVRSGVGAGQKQDLAADLPAGTYALMCFADNLPMWRAYRAAQLDVTG
jgi:hypothetical protein